MEKMLEFNLMPNINYFKCLVLFGKLKIIMVNHAEIHVKDIGANAGTIDLVSEKADLVISSGEPLNWAIFKARQMAIVLDCPVFIDGKPDDGRIIIQATQYAYIAREK